MSMEFEDVLLSEAETEDFIVKHLQNREYIICVHCDREDIPDACQKCEFRKKGFKGNQHGIDITARKNDKSLIIEVKGSDYKHPAAYRVNFWTVLGQIFLDMKHFSEKITYAIAMPYHRHYHSFLFRRFTKSKAIQKLGLHLMLIVKKERRLDILEVVP